MNEVALRGLDPTSGSQAKHDLLTYFEQLKASPNGWLLCADTFVRNVYRDQYVQFFLIQVIEHHIRNRHVASEETEKMKLRQMMLTWIENQATSKVKEKGVIIRKVAQLFALLLLTDYPQQWPTFFADLFHRLHLGVACIEVYLRILLAIDDEITERDVLHTPEEMARNVLIRDTMRQQCVPQLVDSLLQILEMTEQRNDELACLCLDVVGKYVAWIDINLVVNDKVIGMLLRYLGVENLRESATDCLHEIISKGMDPVSKTKLIESVIKLLEDSNILPPAEDEDIDFVAKLANFINGVGMALVSSWNKLVKAHDPTAGQTLDALQSKLPLLFRFLGDEDDDVSQSVFRFAHSYVSTLKSHAEVAEDNYHQFVALLSIVIKKLRYDELYNFEQEGEDEVMFLSYRKQLKGLFDSLVQLNPHYCLMTVQDLASKVFSNIHHYPFCDVEVALRLVYLLGETIPNPHFGVDSKFPEMKELVATVVTSHVSHHSHPEVSQLYFETLVRYEKFFSHEPQHLAVGLASFLDHRGLRNSNNHVRSRCAYLFARFVKQLRTQLHLVAHDALKRIQDLLVLSPENGCISDFVSVDDQMFLYEAAAVLIISTGAPQDKQLLMMKSLMSPVLEKFESSLAKLTATECDTTQQQLAEFIHNLIALGSRTSKAFNSHQTMQQCGCTECFQEALSVFLKVLNVAVHRELLQSAVTQFLHRMIVCLGEDLLPYIPIAVSHLLKDCSQRDLQEFIPLINQLIVKFKSKIQPFVTEIFMPLVHGIFVFLNSEVDELDHTAQKDCQLLHKGYFTFLSALIANGFSQVIADQVPENVHQVLSTLVQGAVDFPDPSTQKTCFACLRRLVDVWGDGQVVVGFDTFIYKSVVPSCFLAPLKAEFDLRDGQTVIALGESGQTMKEILSKRGPECIHFLQTEYLPSLHLAPDTAQDYLQHLQHCDQKTFKSFLKTFFMQLKHQL
ncbi:exportin-T-like [Corticium candelabrum]|uniref:exportin-T-like n=1 Tax=Corticium candelabrum TaxID=121492 RepID=UPI002E254575|nr:exportin-T-like [Corticium candelabrum]